VVSIRRNGGYSTDGSLVVSTAVPLRFTAQPTSTHTAQPTSAHTAQPTK